MSPEAADWWKRAKRSLKSAEMLQDEDPDRSASTAYYAAFYAISALFALEQRSFRKHSAVKTAVHRDLVRSGRWDREIGGFYDSLLAQRVVGDYGGELHVSSEQAREAVRRARRILQAVRDSARETLPE